MGRFGFHHTDRESIDLILCLICSSIPMHNNHLAISFSLASFFLQISSDEVSIKLTTLTCLSVGIVRLGKATSNLVRILILLKLCLKCSFLPSNSTLTQEPANSGYAALIQYAAIPYLVKVVREGKGFKTEVLNPWLNLLIPVAPLLW